MSSDALHVACFPWLAIGHITPFLQLSNRLAQRGCRVSFFVPAKTQVKFDHLNLYPNLIHFIPLTIPHVEGLPLGAETMSDVPITYFSLLAKAFDLTQRQLQNALHTLQPDVILADFAHWLPSMAHSLGIKSIFFPMASTSLISSVFLSSMAPLPSEGKEDEVEVDLVVPVPSEKKEVVVEVAPLRFEGKEDDVAVEVVPLPSEEKEVAVEVVPLCSEEKENDVGIEVVPLPSREKEDEPEVEVVPLCSEEKEDDVGIEVVPLPSQEKEDEPEVEVVAVPSEEKEVEVEVSFYDRVVTSIRESDAICFRGCPEIDGRSCDLIEKQGNKKVLLVGTNLPEPSNTPLEQRWAEWLGGFEKGSVVYCAFGSECVLENAQFQELVLGLEQTGLPFLARLKPPSGVETVEEALPEGFQERVRGRGVVHGGWVQQQQILSHPSVGCFVSHCGFGSMWESLVSTCNIVLVPQIEDQFVNAKFLAEELKVGVEVERRAEDRWFTRESVCKAVKLVMDEGSEVGQEVRANHQRWRELLSTPGLESAYLDNFMVKLQNIIRSK